MFEHIISARKQKRSRFQRHLNALIWKCYLQRQRRWRLLLAETLFAFILSLIMVFIAKPVFLTPLQTEPEPPLTSADLLASLSAKNLLGYAPNVPPYDAVMTRVAELLQTDLEMISAETEDELNDILYARCKGTPIDHPVIWIIFKPKVDNMWRFSIRSTDRARYKFSAWGAEGSEDSNPHLRAGVLGVQVAVSQAVLEHESPSPPKYELSLVSMPVSPLMQETQVRRTISGILLCITIALIPPVIETEALVVTETVNRFKRSLRMRNVDFSTVYMAWLVYAYMTAVPVCVIGALTLILIFRWIHLFFALLILLAYISVMIMIALIMAMFHSKAWIACLWTVLFTLLQSLLAELMVHHKYDIRHEALTFVLHIIVPSLGLVHALNNLALLQTGRGAFRGSGHTLYYTIFLWTFMNMIYFAVLMMMQRTLGARAIGGQVSWKSIIFKKVEDRNRLSTIITPSAIENAKLQEVDDLVAKAISFRNVSKSFMNVSVLNDISLDMYRGEFTMLFAERVQEKIIITIEDLLTGLTQPDQGTINVLGHITEQDTYYLAMPHMMGYCHRSDFLLDDLTVEEHIILFGDICLWNESKQFVYEYIQIRSQRLMVECDLKSVWHEYIRNVGYYYRAQLCWAIALLLEPRIVLIPNLQDKPSFDRVIKDKIMLYKKYLSIVMLSYTSIQLEYADRVFIFDSKVLVFGGTPAYMFFKYGREYRVRMTFRHGSITDNDSENISELLQRAMAAGATVRAHLGSLLILRLPSSPTANVAALMKDLDENASKYGITSMNISLPDSEEVSRRAIYELRAATHETSVFHHNIAKEALKRIAEPLQWKRTESRFLTFAHLRVIMWKFISFYLYHRAMIVVTVVSALLAGVFIGLSLASLLYHLHTRIDRDTKYLTEGEILTVEALEQTTTLILRSDFTDDATSVSNAYVLSETHATPKEIQDMVYTALSHTESLTEYLVTRAIDSPQHYVYMYAYGMDVTSDGMGSITVQVLYSPIHHDHGAAARSLARAYMALLRHYTQKLDASIQVTDEPLTLDLTPGMEYAAKPPLLIQFLLIMTISHITVVPSKEYGLIRHMQAQAMDFSPVSYWLTLYLCDLMIYLVLVAIMTIVIFSLVNILIVPIYLFEFNDLVIVPLFLIIYGMCCVPQAYLFSLGPMPTLNTMAFVIVNIVFGEATVFTNLFHGATLSYTLFFMRLSPQFNMAVAFVKMKLIFLYNSECVVVRKKNLCVKKIVHKCCEKCGILQKCFEHKSYFTWSSGILAEILFMIGTAVVFMVLLLMWEYRLIQRFTRRLKSLFVRAGKQEEQIMTEGAARAKSDVLDKLAQIKSKRSEKVVTYGEYLLAVNVARKYRDVFILRDVFLGVSKGEVLALSGLKRHGRLKLCEVLAGYKVPHSGEMWCMSQWRLTDQPYSYSRNVALCCERDPLPPWMKVYDGLRLLAVLRGIPNTHLHQQVQDIIDALELHDQAYKRISELQFNERAKLHFAAAVIAAPPILVLDECTAYQKYSVRRAVYYILYTLKKRGHGIFISSSNVENHLPITNRLAILVDGFIYDIDHVDSLVERYSNTGCTVVVHLKDEVEIIPMFSRYFRSFAVNDMTEVLVNIQVYDVDLSWSQIFSKMEQLQAENPEVYSYIVSAIPIDYIYNSILTNERGLRRTSDLVSLFCLRKMFDQTPAKSPNRDVMDKLKPFEKKYDITTLKELPWSVIFHR